MDVEVFCNHSTCQMRLAIRSHAIYSVVWSPDCLRLNRVAVYIVYMPLNLLLGLGTLEPVISHRSLPMMVSELFHFLVDLVSWPLLLE